MEDCKKKEDEKIPLYLHLKEEFQSILEVPKELPPSRTYDHRIPLIDRNKSVCARPYKCLYHQKNEIERHIREMLETRVIRESNSPFASFVLLLTKADGSWRMCVDYRALNINTERDKFPIPLIDDLLDELFGAKYFSKLDLRFEYHQIRVVEGDISKTAFKTHEGHYEFLVMPLGSLMHLQSSKD